MSREPLPVVITDGGRAAAGFKADPRRKPRDCFVRSCAIVTGKPYKEIRELVEHYAKGEKTGQYKTKKSHPDWGVFKHTERKVCQHLGMVWVPACEFRQVSRRYLAKDGLPKGRLLVRVSKHFTAVIGGVVHDTHDPCREGTRMVYGWWHRPWVD